MLRILLVVASSYLLGCIVAGYYVGRMLDGSDVRRRGTGNAGARNVARTHGRVAAAVTLTVDAAKGAAAVLLARQILAVEWIGALALVAVVAGHVWPVQLGFRGGKGVASAIGGFLTADPMAAIVTIGVGLGVFLVTRRFSRSGLVAIGFAPVSLVLLQRDWLSVAFVTLAVMIVLLAHHPRADARRRAAFAETAR